MVLKTLLATAGALVVLAAAVEAQATYAQPTAFLRGGNNINTDVIYTLGLGANLRLGGALDVRLGVGLGDVEGVSLGAVWVH